MESSLYENAGSTLAQNPAQGTGIQYVNVKRILPKNHWSIKILEFYNDISRIMEEPIGQNLDCRA